MSKFDAVIPSRDIENAYRTINALVEHSQNLNNVYLIWNGDKKDIPRLDDKFPSNPKNVFILERKPGSEVYSMFNDGVLVGGEYCLLMNDDMYVPPSWDLGLQFYLTPRRVITFKLVEPGYVGVNEANIQNDFGMSYEEFREHDFNIFADAYRAQSEFPGGNGIGWYMPVIFPKDLFIKYGKYPTNPPFPYPNDIVFFEKLKAAQEVEFVQFNSPVYHFQRLSQRPKVVGKQFINELFAGHERLNLCCGDDKRADCLNVDFSGSDFNIDVANGGLKKFPDGHFSYVLFKHALEHFTFEKGEEIIKELFRITREDGIVELYVPDLRVACEDIVIGFNQHDNCAPAWQRIYGQQYNEQLIHRSGYTIDSLLALMHHCGFVGSRQIQCKHADEIGFFFLKTA